MIAATAAAQPPAAPPAETPVWPMYRTLGGLGVICGLLIVGVFELTAPAIRRNRIAARQQAILAVVPGSTTSAAFRFDGSRFAPVAADSDGEGLVFAAYDAVGNIVGLALEAAAMGYQDTIRLLYGYAFAAQAIVGIRVLETRETPGLGDRIEKDAAFLANFVRLDVSLAAGGDRLAHPIEAVKQGQKQQPWQVDCITGATISSAAVANMLRDSAARWIPRVVARRQDFAPEPR